MFESKLKLTGSATRDVVNNTVTYEKRYEITPDGKPIVPGAAPATFGGDDSRYNPEDFMLASLSSCHLLTFIALASKKRMVIHGYADHATGELGANAAGKQQMIKVTLRPHIVFASQADADQMASMHEKAHANCFMANSVNFPVEIEATFEVKA
jgi:organic hydroperoxide reductase OsmC/OhrA